MNELTYDAYERLSAGGALVPVFREIPGDLKTPVSAFLSLAARSERAFLLESVVGGERLARYSFLGRDPVGTLELRGDGLVLRDAEGARPEPRGLLPALRARLGALAAEVPGLPRFTGGAVGYLTYDAVRLFERIPDRHHAKDALLASFAFYHALVAFDHVRQRLVLIAMAEPGRRAAFEQAQGVLDAFEEDLSWELRKSVTRPAPPVPEAALRDGQGFREAVLRAKEYIAAGDIFQVVLSRRQSVDCALDPFTVYRALRMVNPSPYMYFLRDGETTIAGASPEMLVRAEHLMLVDLGRNDIGRVCRFGSVTVPELMKVEHYSHVAHLVSSVTGELADGRDALDALAATFPAGTLSGAPKIRAMEIIDELEPVRRGLYGGALGYLDLRGNLDFCIAIRTLIMQAGQVTLQAGAGIVADSDPAYEERETEAKAGALFEALRLAGGLP